MILYWKTLGFILLTVILAILLDQQEKNIGALLCITACCLCARIAFSYLKPVIDYLFQLEHVCAMDDGLLQILLKISGMGIASHLVIAVCNDMGKPALGKCLELVSMAAVLSASLPLFTSVMDRIHTLLGGL